jgi:hypothetical protein
MYSPPPCENEAIVQGSSKNEKKAQKAVFHHMCFAQCGPWVGISVTRCGDFRLLRDCLLWAVFRKLQKLPKTISQLFSTVQAMYVCINFDRKCGWATF